MSEKLREGQHVRVTYEAVIEDVDGMPSADDPAGWLTLRLNDIAGSSITVNAPYTAARAVGDATDTYAAFAAERMAAGDDPNDIAHGIEAALRDLPDWSQWGNSSYRRDTVCSICGESLAGVCGHSGDPDRRLVLRREYEAAKHE